MRASRSLESPTSSGLESGSSFDVMPMEPTTRSAANATATVRVSRNIRVSLFVEHLSHALREQVERIRFGQELDAFAQYPVMHDDVGRVARCEEYCHRGPQLQQPLHEHLAVHAWHHD